MTPRRERRAKKWRVEKLKRLQLLARRAVTTTQPWPPILRLALSCLLETTHRRATTFHLPYRVIRAAANEPLLRVRAVAGVARTAVRAVGAARILQALRARESVPRTRRLLRPLRRTRLPAAGRIRRGLKPEGNCSRSWCGLTSRSTLVSRRSSSVGEWTLGSRVVRRTGMPSRPPR